MVTKIFTVYDSKAEAYLQPFTMATRGEALRSFADTVADPNHQFNRHASDFTLFELGEFDNLTCSFLIYEAKISLGSANEFKSNISLKPNIALQPNA